MESVNIIRNMTSMRTSKYKSHTTMTRLHNSLNNKRKYTNADVGDESSLSLEKIRPETKKTNCQNI